jgi:hypothetical protein
LTYIFLHIFFLHIFFFGIYLNMLAHDHSPGCFKKATQTPNALLDIQIPI